MSNLFYSVATVLRSFFTTTCAIITTSAFITTYLPAALLSESHYLPNLTSRINFNESARGYNTDWVITTRGYLRCGPFSGRGVDCAAVIAVLKIGFCCSHLYNTPIHKFAPKNSLIVIMNARILWVVGRHRRDPITLILHRHPRGGRDGDFVLTDYYCWASVFSVLKSGRPQFFCARFNLNKNTIKHTSLLFSTLYYENIIQKLAMYII